MIPSTSNKLLVAEDWTKIYQTFKNADFKSYDFETLRRTMINYLRENYPEEFNDYIDSSEFIALVDLIAFLGQNLSFRIDLNARENFLETAERRESVLRLAKLINYNVNRNIPAHGFLKITSIVTSENVIDANGVNLSNSIIGWNDPTNANWYQQFIAIMNSAMSGLTIFGKPAAKGTIGGVATEQYKINSNSTGVPVYSFNKNIGGTQMSFELVSSTFSGQNYIYEEPPLPANQFGIIYKNDNGGSSSANTGFFVQFKQGALSSANFSVTNPVPNEVIGLNVPNINNSDVWLWQMSANGSTHESLWTKVEATTGNNIIYNSLNSSIRDIYSVATRENDQIDLTFADGSFGNLPNGAFKVYYRQSNGLAYSIKPEQMNNISVQIPYTSKSGQAHNLTIILSLQYTVNNSATAESNDDVRVKAPQAYYTQNRMITAEDYNIAPLTVDSDVLKVKSINRVSSGISKYYELSDISGNYSSTNIFANDGILYKQRVVNSFDFPVTDTNEVRALVKSKIAPIFKLTSLKSFYLENYPRLDLSTTGLSWNRTLSTTNQTRGYFYRPELTPKGAVSIGPDYSAEVYKFFEPGALIKFVPAPKNGLPQYYLPSGEITPYASKNTRPYMWSQVAGVIGDGANFGAGNLADGTGPVIMTGILPGNGSMTDSSIPASLVPKFKNKLTSTLEVDIVNLIVSKRNFGLAVSLTSRDWYIISDSNLDLTSTPAFTYQQDVSNLNKDSSWLISFEWTGKKYIVRHRATEYIFESDKETAFFVDTSKKNYDFVNDSVIKDKIDVLGVNPLNTTGTVLFTATTAIHMSPNIEVRYLSTSSAISNGISSNLYLDISSGTNYTSYAVIHPLIPTGQAVVNSVNTQSGYVNISGPLPTVIPASSPVTFVERNISYTSYSSYFTTNEIDSLVSLGTDYSWQIDSAVVEPDGYIQPKKVLVSFYDNNEDGQIDDPNAFDNIVATNTTSPVTNYRDKFVYFKISDDGLRYSLYKGSILAYPAESLVNNPVLNQLYYFYNGNIDVVKRYTNDGFVLEPSYFAKSGRPGLKFHYMHNSGQERRIDPSKSNIIDIYILSKTYDLAYRNWLTTGIGTEPLPATTQSLEENYSGYLEPIKSISDEIIFHPAKYKVLFGSQAALSLQATFKAVANPARSVSATSIQTRILAAINEFFAIDKWEFGQTFNFSELATYVMNIMTPDIINFVIVPISSDKFGSLYQITCQGNEIFVNGATVDNIQVIDSLTASELKLTSMITSG